MLGFQNKRPDQNENAPSIFWKKILIVPNATIDFIYCDKFKIAKNIWALPSLQVKEQTEYDFDIFQS